MSNAQFFQSSNSRSDPESRLEGLRNEETSRMDDGADADYFSEIREYEDSILTQALFDDEIRSIEQSLRLETVLEDGEVLDTVSIGNTITIRYSHGFEEHWKVVRAEEANPREGLLSVTSPIGMAVLGKQSGEIVELETLAGIIRFQILDISGGSIKLPAAEPSIPTVDRLAYPPHEVSVPPAILSSRETDQSNIEIQPPLSKQDESQTLVVRIREDPLTAQNLVRTISAVIRLHTACRLMTQGRFPDLVRYTRTHDPRVEEEAALGISILQNNRQLEFTLNDVTKETAEALRITISGLEQTKQRHRETVFKNRQLAADIRQTDQQIRAVQAKQEWYRRPIVEKALLEQNQAEQEWNLSAQQANIERQRAEISLQKSLLNLELQRVDLVKALLEERRDQLAERISLALELAGKIVDQSYSVADSTARTLLIHMLLPELLQLGSVKGLQFAQAAGGLTDTKAEMSQNPASSDK